MMLPAWSPEGDLRRLLFHCLKRSRPSEREDVAHRGLARQAAMSLRRATRSTFYGYGKTGRGGVPDGDTVYEIGSVTKTFTSLWLAAQAGVDMKLEDPVATYLPKNVVVSTRSGKPITLGELSTHTSGLPRLPTNLAPADWNDPYAEPYSEVCLSEFIFVQGKVTNQDLYDWMSGQISVVYFQAYQMAYQVAKRAEKAYQIELATPKESFIDVGNWDNQRQGLLAGEKLQFDLRRMELHYLDENRRELEITKHISLAQSFPNSLLELALTGTTTLALPESLFDADYPGHYLRRLRTVSLSLPGVAAPYASVNCTLTQTASSVRKDTLNKAASVVQSYVNIQRVVTSSGTNDAGLFELNLHDERYLPFEGSGVISTWRIDLPAATNAFDVSALDDVVMQIRYPARDGGDEFRKSVAKPPNTPVTGTWLVRASADQATAWYAFKNLAANTTSQVLALDLSSFPYLPGGGSVSVANLEAVAQGPKGAPLALSFTVSARGLNRLPPPAPFKLTTASSASFASSKTLPLVVLSGAQRNTWTWTLDALPPVNLSQLIELWIRVTYAQVP